MRRALHGLCVLLLLTSLLAEAAGSAEGDIGVEGDAPTDTSIAPNTAVLPPWHDPPAGSGEAGTEVSPGSVNLDQHRSATEIDAWAAPQFSEPTVPFWVPALERGFFSTGTIAGPSGIGVVTTDGVERLLPDVPMTDNYRGPWYAEGRLFLLGETRIAELDVDSGATIVVHTLDVPSGHFPSSAATLGDEILIGWSDGSLTRLDRSDGTSSPVTLPAGLDSFGVFSHHHAWGDHLAFHDGSDLVIYDAAVEPFVEVSRTEAELVSVAPDGTLVTRSIDRTSVAVRSLPALTELSVHALATDFRPVVHYAPEAELLVFARGWRLQLVEHDGTVAAELPSSAEFSVTPDASRVFSLGGVSSARQLVTHTTASTAVESSMELFRPELARSLRVAGWNMAHVTGASVEGQSVPFEVRGSGDQTMAVLDLTGIPTPDTEQARIEFESRFGRTEFTIPVVLRHGRSIVTVRGRVTTGTHGLVSYIVECADELWRASAFAGDAVVLDVPSQRDCEARWASAGRHEVRSGFGDERSPWSFADTSAFRLSFRSGGPVHAVFERQPGRELGRVWLFTFPIGAGSLDMVYVFDVTCDDVEQRYRVPAGFGVRVDVPPGQTCRAELVKDRGAVEVRSHVVTPNKVGKDRGRRLRWRTDSVRGDYLAFVIDHGEPDPRALLAVGSPGEDIGSKADAGVVQLFPTSTDGRVSGVGAITLRQGRGQVPGRAQAGDRFGDAVELGDFDRDGLLDVAISAPLEDVGSVRNAGAVTVVHGVGPGAPARRGIVLHQDRSGVPGQAGRNDRFGTALAVVDWNGDGFDDLAVGVPGEDTAGVKNSGLVQIFLGGPSGLGLDGVVELTQASPGMFTDAERNDRFGSVLAGNEAVLVIGVPNEDIAGVKNAGMIHVVDGLSGEQIWTRQGRPEHGQAAEKNDRFGEVIEMVGQEFWVGVPREDLGSAKNAGMVARYSYSRAQDDLSHDSARRLEWGAKGFGTNAQDLGRAARSGDRFGASVALLSTGGRNPSLFPVIGAPGMDGGTGAVLIEAGTGIELQPGTDGVPGSSTERAAFGDEVHIGPWGVIVVASPDATAGGRERAGRIASTIDLESWHLLSQASKGSTGRAERGDRFGSVLAS